MNVDVTLLRIIAVVLLFISGGAMVVVYLILMLLLPYAADVPAGERVGKLPAKCREWVVALRTKLGVAAA